MRQVAIDVLDRDGRVIDQNAHGKRQSAEGHDVDGLADRAQHDDRRQDRKGNRNRDDQRAAPASQEDQDHQPGQARGNDRFPDDPVDGGADKQGLVRDGPDAQFWRQASQARWAGLL